MTKPITITPIPAFQDNYIWLIEHTLLKQAVVIDPGEAKPIKNYLEKNDLSLHSILITHRHPDHIGGIEELCKAPSLLADEEIPIYGPKSTHIPMITHHLKEGDNVNLFNVDSQLTTMATPGHTDEHISYYGRVSGQSMIFCGDTLFSAGCGRVRDGKPEQLYHSLQRLSALPNDTVIYCTHEYTLDNLRFATAVEPNNPALQQHQEAINKKRQLQQPSLPTTLAAEKAFNPFLRCHLSHMRERVNQYWQTEWLSSEEIFIGLRRWKDEFTG